MERKGEIVIHEELKPYAFGMSEISKPQNFQKLFISEQPLVLDIGAGKGEFVEKMAKIHPDWNFLCIELKFHRVKTIVKRARKNELDNIRIIHGRIEHLIPHCFFNKTVSHAYMNFPDPWQKKRQSKNRTMSPLFCSRMSDLLVAGGIFHFATDVKEYAEYAFQCLENHPDFQNFLEPKRYLEDIPEHYKTLFYQHAQRSGFDSHFLKFKRV